MSHASSPLLQRLRHLQTYSHLCILHSYAKCMRLLLCLLLKMCVHSKDGEIFSICCSVCQTHIQCTFERASACSCKSSFLLLMDFFQMVSSHARKEQTPRITQGKLSLLKSSIGLGSGSPRWQFVNAVQKLLFLNTAEFPSFPYALTSTHVNM